MLKKILTALALLGACLVVAPTPAANSAILTDVTHAADDSGYAAPIHALCTNGVHRYLYRGESTFFDTAKSCGGGGVERIIVGYDQTVRCLNMLPPYGWHTFYTGRYNEVPSYASLKCYMQRPL